MNSTVDVSKHNQGIICDETRKGIHTTLNKSIIGSTHSPSDLLLGSKWLYAIQMHACMLNLHLISLFHIWVTHTHTHTHTHTLLKPATQPVTLGWRSVSVGWTMAAAVFMRTISAEEIAHLPWLLTAVSYVVIQNKTIMWAFCMSYRYVSCCSCTAICLCTSMTLANTSTKIFFVVAFCLFVFFIYSYWLWFSEYHKWSGKLPATRKGPNTHGCNSLLHLQQWLHTEWKHCAYLPGKWCMDRQWPILQLWVLHELTILLHKMKHGRHTDNTLPSCELTIY